MFAHAAFSPNARATALVLRRLKWHRAEYNRIDASWGSLDGGLHEVAREAMTGHKWAIVECEAILRGEEPLWGDEREITEKYLDELPTEEDLALGFA